MQITNIPFHIGASDSDSNPKGVPNVLDFSLCVNEELSLLQQDLNDSVKDALEKSYCFGKLIGTPLSESEDGKPYADDFIKFIFDNSPGKNALEIGCGMGYLLKRLQEHAYNVVGIEPGEGYMPYWKKYEVNVVNDFFPSRHANKLYDLVYGYMLLEHIEQPVIFIKNVCDQLNENGVAIFAVPDCSEEIENNDPAILIHEHISYFDKNSLCNLFKYAGMNAEIYNSKYGRSLYVFAKKDLSNSSKDTMHFNNTDLHKYLINVENTIKMHKKLITKVSESGPTGIYCPSRALNILDIGLDVRFFDDDPYLYKKFLPPFKNPIENLQDCLENPPKNIIIASRTFYNKIQEKLIKGNFTGTIINLFDSN